MTQEAQKLWKEVPWFSQMLITKCYQSYQEEGLESILSWIIVDKLYYLQDTGKMIIHLKRKAGERLWASFKGHSKQ